MFCGMAMNNNQKNYVCIDYDFILFNILFYNDIIIDYLLIN